MKHYLVTGGLGFLGSPLIRMLVARGDRVRVLDDLSRGSTRRLKGAEKDFEIVNGDIRDWRVVERSIAGVDAVIHLAFVNGTRHFYEKPAYVLDVGVKGMVNVLDACIKHSVKELILASSSEVYQTPPLLPTPETVPLSIPDPLNPRYSYGGGKIISELMAINYGKCYLDRVLIFRPHNVFGPDMGWEHVIPNFVSRMTTLDQAGDEPRDFEIQGSGEQYRSFIYIDDFVEGLLCVIDRGQHLNIYNIGVEEIIQVGALAKAIAEHLRIRIRVAPGPEAAGATSSRCPDTTKVQALGFQPKWSFSAALKLTVDWYRQHPQPLPSQAVGEDRIFLR